MLDWLFRRRGKKTTSIEELEPESVFSSDEAFLVKVDSIDGDFVTFSIRIRGIKYWTYRTGLRVQVGGSFVVLDGKNACFDNSPGEGEKIPRGKMDELVMKHGGL